MQCKKSEAAEKRLRLLFVVVRVTVRAGGSARARGRRVSVDSVVDLLVYMYIVPRPPGVARSLRSGRRNTGLSCA